MLIVCLIRFSITRSSLARHLSRAHRKPDVQVDRTSSPPPGSDRPRRRIVAIAVLTAALCLIGAGTFLLSQRLPPGGAAASGAESSAHAAVQGHSARPGATSSSGPAVPGPWHLVFADDFSEPALDASRWVTCYDWNVDGCTNATNHELQWYTPGKVSVAHGAATLTAQRTPTRGSDGKLYSWTSGMLSTGRPSWNSRPRFTFTYGYLEARLKMPPEKGMFPAFWLLTADEKVDPEVDVVEMIGSRTAAFMNLHWTTASGVKAQAPKTFESTDFSTGYHDFAIDWEPGSMTWYIDGAARYTLANSRAVPAVPMEIIFTLAVGFPDPPPANVSTGSMSIEHVRLWQH